MFMVRTNSSANKDVNDINSGMKCIKTYTQICIETINVKKNTTKIINYMGLCMIRCMTLVWHILSCGVGMGIKGAGNPKMNIIQYIKGTFSSLVG